MSPDFTLGDLEAVARTVHEIGAGNQPIEAFFALINGWIPEEFQNLYALYIASTQSDLSLGNNTTHVKGDPLEEVSRYFLHRGGVVRNMKPGGLPAKWTVDGIGETYPDRVLSILGREAAKKCGPQLYMEAKNHQHPMKPEHWAQHRARMGAHGCTFGVAVSTAGFAIGRGLGFADDPFHEWLSGSIHILLSVDDLRRAAAGELPWSVIRTAFVRLTNQGYEQADVQRAYSEVVCTGLARSEYHRLQAIPETGA